MKATFTTTVTAAPTGYVAIATFAPGLFAARRPIVGPAAATAQLAIAGLYALPKLHITIAAIASK